LKISGKYFARKLTVVADYTASLYKCTFTRSQKVYTTSFSNWCQHFTFCWPASCNDSW